MMALKMPIKCHNQEQMIGRQETADSARLKLAEQQISSSLSVSTKQRYIPDGSRWCKTRSWQTEPAKANVSKAQFGRIPPLHWHLQEPVHLRTTVSAEALEEMLSSFLISRHRQNFLGVTEQNCTTFTLWHFFSFWRKNNIPTDHT